MYKAKKRSGPEGDWEERPKRQFRAKVKAKEISAAIQIQMDRREKWGGDSERLPLRGALMAVRRGVY